MIFQTRLQEFLPQITELKQEEKLDKSELLTEIFLIEKEKDVALYYSPHNEWINTGAKIIIVGITPGWQQMQRAYLSMVHSLNNGNQENDIIRASKMAARFSGQMRGNLCDMLDEIQLPELFHLCTARELFQPDCNLLHTTSVIRYPLFVNGRNYTGYSPEVDKSPMLKHYAYEVFPLELNSITEPALIIPLGKATETIVAQAKESNLINKHHILTGFPHPSGANGHRRKQFQQNKKALQDNIEKFFEEID